MADLFLLGESGVIDNFLHLEPGEFTVHEQIAALLPEITVVMREMGSNTAGSAVEELAQNPLPEDAAVFLSVGSSDAFGPVMALVDPEQRDFAETMVTLRELREWFRIGFLDQPGLGFAGLLDALAGRRVLVATIYDLNLFGPEAALQQPADAAHSFYNDVIQQEALARGFDILDLRALFTDPTDHVGGTGPSVAGSAKIARAVADWMESAE